MSDNYNLDSDSEVEVEERNLDLPSDHYDSEEEEMMAIMRNKVSTFDLNDGSSGSNKVSKLVNKEVNHVNKDDNKVNKQVNKEENKKRKKGKTMNLYEFDQFVKESNKVKNKDVKSSEIPVKKKWTSDRLAKLKENK